MRLATLLAVASLAFFAGLVELVAGLASPVGAIALAAVIGCASVAIPRATHFDRWPVWAAIAAPTLGVLAGSAVTLLGALPSRRILLAPVLCAVCAAATWLIGRAKERRCSLCDRRLAGSLAFTCPRCALLVCESRCWDPHHLRCRLCLQNKVPVLPPDDRWWDAQLGRRATQGVCQHCHGSAEHDLRACQRCGRPQCRECWDHLNAACARCNWVIAELPGNLARFLVPDAPGAAPKLQERRR